ncbi:hypothetical protein RJ640_020644 [Escallonia rubra]|uniref:Protein MIZU-KUSSEI 1 n=1 Tax=Escallonia rubra TaxID=112253 RepID=A0AA88RFY6_9ASTE|nr:hypothetical protein RJ640_020644 [Escallonia rubra]
MVDLGSQRGQVLHLMSTATSVDCGSQVRRTSSFRSLMECMVPACCGGFQPTSPSSLSDSSSNSLSSSSSSSSTSSASYESSPAHHSPSTSTVTGTFFGHRKGRVSFCLQDSTKSSRPLLLLEFGVPTSYLAREMRHGVLRIALECCGDNRRRVHSGSRSLYGVPVWSMYCNGRKVGYSVKRQVTANDATVLKVMQSISVGAGVLPKYMVSSGIDGGGDDQLMYLRAKFERVIGSTDSESFYMINPDGSSGGQDLSIFLLRSRVTPNGP